MKSQRRHDLQQNTLRLELNRGYEFLRTRGNYVAWAVLGVAVVVFGTVWLVNRSRAEAVSVQAQYTRLAQMPAGNPDRLSELKALAGKDSYPMWAALAQNEVGVDYLWQLADRWPQLTPADRKSIADLAKASFQEVIEKFPKQDLAVAKAHLGLGKMYETMGDIENAKGEYQAVQQTPGLTGEPIVNFAAESLARLEQLKSQGTVRMAATAPSTQPTTAEAASQPATAAAKAAPATGASVVTGALDSGAEKPSTSQPVRTINILTTAPAAATQAKP